MDYDMSYRIPGNIGDLVVNRAREIFEFAKCGSDFCIQNVDSDSAVFGGDNRLCWNPVKGFWPDRKSCSRKFLDGFDRMHASMPERRKCDDCGKMFSEDQGRPYKYEKAVWLCDDCHDARMDEN